MSWIQLLSGEAFEPCSPNASLIHIDDLVVSAARICRFRGHCKYFYSVAQHQMLVADILVDAGLGHLELPGLLHDMHETLSGFGDVLHPVKVMNPEVYKFIDTVERSIDVAIGQRFDVDHNLFRDPCVQLADQRALATEKRDIITKCARNWRELPPPVDYNIMPMHEDYVIHTFTDRLKSLLKTHVS